jgi:transposase
MRAADLTKLLLAVARKSHACRLLMTIPGVGAITATSYVTAIEEPSNFKTSRAVGAWLGLTSRRYQSGEVDYSGRISRRGDRHLRGLLYEAALVILTRSKAQNDLQTWARKLKERVCAKCAADALALKLAVTMHAMLKTGSVFNPIAQPLSL